MAATVAIAPLVVDDYEGDAVMFDAAAGERNRVTLRGAPSGQAGGAWTITDRGATITVGRGCRRSNDHTVICRPRAGRPLYAIQAHLGDRDDRLRWWGDRFLVHLLVSGGAGDDDLGGPDAVTDQAWLNGGPGDDRVIGSLGQDRMDGGSGRDRLRGRAGRDTLSGGDHGRGQLRGDILDGGRDVDTVDYGRRRGRVVVDLAHGRGGAPGEDDRLVAIEEVQGGSGDDRLFGDQGENWLRGGPGRDLLAGRGGNDVLMAESDGARVACGAGADFVAGELDGELLLERDCERFLDNVIGLESPQPEPIAGLLSYRISCPIESFDEGTYTHDCSGIMRIREAQRQGRLLATARFTPLGAWEDHPLPLKWTPLGRRLASRRDGVLADIALSTRAAFQPPVHERYRWTIRLQLPSA